MARKLNSRHQPAIWGEIILKQYFVKQAIKEVELEQFIRDSFPEGDYSKIVLQRTPLGLKVVIFTNKPGRIIGRGGRNIDLINQALKEKFAMENPQIDIKSVDNPDLDANIVAKQIASALERGYNYKKIGNVFLKRVMDAGAIGVEIIIAGKMGGAMSRMAKFIDGYIKHSGQTAIDLVDTGFYEALPKLGKIGVTARIMKEFQDITGEIKDIKFFREEPSKIEIAEIKEEEKEVENVIQEKAATEEKPKAKTPRARKPKEKASGNTKPKESTNS